jgi:hypothetical protein
LRRLPGSGYTIPIFCKLAFEGPIRGRYSSGKEFPIPI